MQEAFDWNEEPPLNQEAEYQALLRGLRRKRGFGLYFVQCSPVEGTRLIERLQQDLMQKRIGVLKFNSAIEDGNFYRCAAECLQTHSETEILFVQGLEYSLLSYEKTKREEGWSSEEIYSYSWKAVPRLLGNLNLQREKFRDNFSVRFVFLLPLFALKYLIRRAPDFFDWRSGVFEIPTDSELLHQESSRVFGSYVDYLSWTQQERDHKIIEIQCWIEEPQQTLERRTRLLHEQGNLFYASRKYEEAITSYSRALEIKPEYHQAWYNRGLSFANLKRYEEAVTSYDKALKYKSDYYEAWYNRGLSLANLKRYEEAIASYSRALEIKLEYHQAWYNRGLSLANLGRYEEAVNSYDKALKCKPDYYEAWYSRGLSFANLGRYEEAIASYDKALEVRSDSNDTWHYRGVALDELGSYEQATQSYDIAVQLQPDNYHSWLRKTLSLIRLARYEEAISSSDKVVQLNPDNSISWYQRGILLMFCSRREKTKTWEKILGKVRKALSLLSHFADQSSTQEESQQLLVASLEEMMELLEEAQRLMTKFTEAITCFDKSLELQPNHADSLYDRACCHALINQIEQTALIPIPAFAPYLRLCSTEPVNLELDSDHIEQVVLSLRQAISFNPNCREKAKTDSAFDSIRNDDRFQALINTE